MNATLRALTRLGSATPTYITKDAQARRPICSEGKEPYRCPPARARSRRCRSRDGRLPQFPRGDIISINTSTTRPCVNIEVNIDVFERVTAGKITTSEETATGIPCAARSSTRRYITKMIAAPATPNQPKCANPSAKKLAFIDASVSPVVTRAIIRAGPCGFCGSMKGAKTEWESISNGLLL